MQRVEPLSDLTVYLIVFGVVASMMLGKYILFKDDKKDDND